jgi:type IV pilus assembly protein PilF
MRKLIPFFCAMALVGCATGGAQKNASEEHSPRNRAQLHTDLAAAYYGQGQMAIALDEYNKATTIDPRYAPAYTGLGLLYASLKQDDKAENAFKRALQIEPDNSEAHNNYGTFLCVRNRIDESLGEFAKAVSNPLYATPAAAYLNSGICSLKKKDAASAENYFLKALQADPNSRAAAFQLGKLYFNRGDQTKAHDYIQQSMQGVNPTPEMLWLGIRNARLVGDKDAEASYSLLLKKKYPNSEETKALQAE